MEYQKDYTDPEFKVSYLEQQIAYKDQEIEFLKYCVFRTVGSGIMNIPASAKYSIIREMTQRDNNLLNIVWLCAVPSFFREGHRISRALSDGAVSRKAVLFIY